MVADPTMTTASMTLSSIMKIYSDYSAYKSTKVKDTDKGLRDDIDRRITMVRRHVDSLEARYLKDKNVEAIDILNRARTTLTAFSHDVQYGSVGTTEQVSLAKSLKKGQVKTLMGHDLAVLKRLVEATRMVNALLDGQGRNEDRTTQLHEFEQTLVGVQNQFNDRTSFLAKL